MSTHCICGETEAVGLVSHDEDESEPSLEPGLLVYDGLLSRTLRNGWGLLGQREKGAEVLHTLRTAHLQRAISPAA